MGVDLIYIYTKIRFQSSTCKTPLFFIFIYFDAYIRYTQNVDKILDTIKELKFLQIDKLTIYYIPNS